MRACPINPNHLFRTCGFFICRSETCKLTRIIANMIILMALNLPGESNGRTRFKQRRAQNFKRQKTQLKIFIAIIINKKLNADSPTYKAKPHNCSRSAKNVKYTTIFVIHKYLDKKKALRNIIKLLT